jgi:hypothetical protein
MPGTLFFGSYRPKIISALPDTGFDFVKGLSEFDRSGAVADGSLKDTDGR